MKVISTQSPSVVDLTCADAMSGRWDDYSFYVACPVHGMLGKVDDGIEAAGQALLHAVRAAGQSGLRGSEGCEQARAAGQSGLRGSEGCEQARAAGQSGLRGSEGCEESRAVGQSGLRGSEGCGAVRAAGRARRRLLWVDTWRAVPRGGRGI